MNLISTHFEAFVLHIHGVGKALQSACVLAATVPPRRAGVARNSFHARSNIERGGNIANALLGAVKVKDYKCPKCGEIHNDQDDGYEVDGIKFPQYFNESKGSTMDGNYHDWDELHKCENCGTEYWFRNGAY